MKKFICAICGYLHEGSEAPANCPVCKAPAVKFSEQSGAQAGNTEKSEKPDTSNAENGIVEVAGKEVAKVEGSIELADKYYDAEEYDKALPNTAFTSSRLLCF